MKVSNERLAEMIKKSECLDIETYLALKELQESRERIANLTNI